MTQMDRIEIKLDALLNILAKEVPEPDDVKTVVAEGQALGKSMDEIVAEFNRRKLKKK